MLLVLAPSSCPGLDFTKRLPSVDCCKALTRAVLDYDANRIALLTVHTALSVNLAEHRMLSSRAEYTTIIGSNLRFDHALCRL